ncbi:hypothetical protein N234_36360 [Ralstonia pickettii DTP0602]|nr:hypothetical protein N234_36360 [Ralstonia pickettii DTP0602]
MKEWSHNSDIDLVPEHPELARTSAKAQAFFDVRISRMSAPGNERRAEVGRELDMRKDLLDGRS